MFKRFCGLTAAFLLCALSFAQADPKRFTWGAGAMSNTPLDYAALVKEGRTHLRKVWRVKAEYPGQGAPPVLSIDVPAIRADIKKAFAAGFLGYIIAVEGTAQEMDALAAQTAAGDPSRLDAPHIQAAELSLEFASTRVMAEMGAGEPGFTRYAYKVVFTGNRDVFQKAAWINEAWHKHLIPKIRAKAPKLTLLVNLCNFGNPAGEMGELQFAGEFWANAYFTLHDYASREFSHNGLNGAALIPFVWPELAFDQKLAAAGKDASLARYNNGPYPQSEDGEVLKTFKAVNQAKMPLFVGEYGAILPWRNDPEAKKYIECKRKVWRAFGVGVTEWVG